MTKASYPQVVEWLARDVLSSTETAEDVEANVDRYMEDLTSSVQEKAGELAKSNEFWQDEPQEGEEAFDDLQDDEELTP